MKRLILFLITALLIVLTGPFGSTTILAQSPPEVWVVNINGFENGSEFAKDGMAIDSEGSIYLCGGSTLNSDILVMKYNSNGVLQWSAKYGRAGVGDRAHTIALDNVGNVYITGESYTDSSSGVDFITIKYSNSGARQWIARYSGPGFDHDSGHALVVDDAGNVYVTGRSRIGGFTGGSNDNYDYATIKYNSNGIEQWTVRYNGLGNGMDFPKAIGIDDSGNVYVTGSSYNGTNRDYATIKYDNNGTQIWEARYTRPGNGDDYAIAMTVDNSGNIYVTGNYATIKYSSDGVEQWVAMGVQARDIAVDNSSNVYVTGLVAGVGGADFATIKYNKDGVEQWKAQYNGPDNGIDRAVALAVDVFGNVYINGITGYGSTTSQDFVTIKYDKNGVENWLVRYNSLGNGNDWVTAIAVEGNGNVFVTGVIIGDPFGDPYESESVLIKYRNQPPELSPIGGKAVNEGESLSFTISGNDPDGDTLIYSVSNLPDGAVFNPETKTFSWTPSFDLAGIYPNINFSISEGYFSDSEYITITVIDVNRPPTITAGGNKTVNEGELLSFMVQATDPDGDELNYTASNLPAGAIFDVTTRNLSWTPGFDQAGSFTINFEASDGRLSASGDITITVNNVIQPLLFIIGGIAGFVIIGLLVWLRRRKIKTT